LKQIVKSGWELFLPVQRQCGKQGRRYQGELPFAKRIAKGEVKEKAGRVGALGQGVFPKDPFLLSPGSVGGGGLGGVGVGAIARFKGRKVHLG